MRRFLQLGLLLILAGCDEPKDYPDRPITLICPWGVGGGTDLVSRQMAVHLEDELGVPVNVINATGGKGVTGHSRGLRAKPDGYTITMITLELNMLPWSVDAVDFTHKDFLPLATINEDAAALFVRAGARWASLSELERHIQEHPGELTASGTARGGAWHVAVVGWLESRDGLDADDVRWISSQGAATSLLELKNGGVDLVCCSLPEARLLLEGGFVRCLGVMAERAPDGFERFGVQTFREQGVAWTLVGWRGLAVPRDTPAEIADQLRAAVIRIVSRPPTGQGDTFREFMDQERFNVTLRSGDALTGFLEGNDEKFRALLQSAPFAATGDQPLAPMTLPYALIAMLGLTAICLVGRVLTIERVEPDEEQAAAPSPNLFRFVLVIGAVVGYIYSAETAGFLLTLGGILLLMLWLYGTRLRTSLIVTLLFVPAVYQLFAHVLRVPLPKGWLGW